MRQIAITRIGNDTVQIFEPNAVRSFPVAVNGVIQTAIQQDGNGVWRGRLLEDELAAAIGRVIEAQGF